MWKIVGDYDIYGEVKTCLIFVGGNTKEEAEATLNKYLSNPTKYKYEYERLHEARNVRVQEDKEPWYMEDNATLGD
jgi:predicted component of viral defense system (DUF524 family)